MVVALRRRRSVPATAAVVLVVVALAAGIVGCAVDEVDDTVAASSATTDTTSDPAGAGAQRPSTVPTAEAAGVAVLPVTVTSADGRRVTVTDTSRIVPLQGSISEILFALGLGESVVARDISATFDEVADLPLVTRAHDVSAESVLSLRPTLVLADTDTGPPEAVDHLRNVGVPVVVVERPTSVAGVGEHIATIAEAAGVPDAGRALAAEVEAEIAAVTAEVEDADHPTVAFLYLRGRAGVYLLGGPGAGTDSMIEAAGGRDAGVELGLERAFTPLTSEALVAAAPDVILMTTTGLESVGGVDGLLEVAGVAQTPAGMHRRVVTVEDGLLFGFGARTPEALRLLADGLRVAEPVA
ncbi:MAG: ABC transporter substrate-binding protein [Acidimicrobiia bacterium]|nr:ABC transporter substrate-binding protein [Acidimicrobiia bacterium]